MAMLEEERIDYESDWAELREYLDENGWAFRKSKYSSDTMNCVEVSIGANGIVTVQDSKDPSGPALMYTKREWQAFVKDVKEGAFDIE